MPTQRDANGQAKPVFVALPGKISLETIDFVGARLRKDLATGVALSECRSIDGLAKLQRSWVSEAVEDYTAEASKMLKLAADTLGPVKAKS